MPSNARPMNTAIAMASPKRPATSIGSRLSSIGCCLFCLCRLRARLSQRQRLFVARQFQIAAADILPMLADPHRAFPIDGTGGEASVVLLIIHQRLEQKIPTCGAYLP